jgi:hypothetical protein
MHISNFKVVFLKFGPCAHHAVEQVPQLSLQEEAANLAAVIYLHLKNIGIVIVGELYMRDMYLDESAGAAEARGLVYCFVG